ncbi:hypothetical protein B0H63DRAFT_494124 [Podospora didyma]|uniref:SET domain-containing protein n=1 Tax=Podospora didyma TaxID=330526 RepID=A0AAE0TZ86_9PEZI|nr:hypothetical protein B0H63DRAFT_494124 [Podospora didyma]
MDLNVYYLTSKLFSGSSRNIWSPWSHRPECIDAPDGKGTKYCAFTNSRHGRRGMSVVTKPEIAADIVGILDQPVDATVPGSEDVRIQTTSPYRIVDVPGKGKGVIATRLIKRHEQIMIDYASLLVDISFATAVPAWTGYRILHAAVNQLSDTDSILDLGQSNGQASDAVENILRTNAFHTMLGGEPHMALYPMVSLSAYTRFIPQTIQVSVGAARDIKPGEEIGISYITLGQTAAERFTALQQWGFNCTCDLCTASKAEISASDARRKKIDLLREQAIDAFQSGKPYQALRLTRQVLNLLPSEELFPLYSEQYENMARIYWVLRDMKKAEENARISLEILAEQGYIERFRPEYLDMMWRRFEQEERSERT